MAEYIEKGSFLDFMKSKGYTMASVKTIREFPAAGAAPEKRGRWINPHWHNSTHCMDCSVCDGEAQHSEFYGVEINYTVCPHCGAKMDLEESGKEDTR